MMQSRHPLSYRAKRRILEAFEGKERFLEPGELEIRPSPEPAGTLLSDFMKVRTVSIVEVETETPTATPRARISQPSDSEVENIIEKEDDPFALQQMDNFNPFISLGHQAT